MAPIAPAAALRFGVRFHPSPERAIDFYLHRWVLGQDLDTTGIVYEAKVYSCEPKKLAAEFPRLPKTHDRFFFTTCKRMKAGKDHRMLRTAGDGSWVSQSKKEVKNEAGETIGWLHKLSFCYERSGGKPEPSGWLMDEYRCLLEKALVDETEERVFCKIYASPRLPTGSSTHRESAAGDRLQEPTPRMPVQEPIMAMQRQARQEPRPPVAVPVITQPQALTRPAPPCRVVPRAASEYQSMPSLGPGQRRVMAPPVPVPVVTQPQAPKKRPAPPISEQPCPKKMRPVVKPASAPHLPRPASRQVPLPTPSVPLPPQRFKAPVTGPRPAWEPPMHPGLLSAFGPSPTQPLRQPVLTSPVRPAPPRSPVAAPPRPTEAPATAEDDDDDLLNLIEGKLMEAAEDDDMDEFARSVDEKLELVEGHDQIQKPGAAEGDMGMHATSLEGLVADERGDHVIAQEASDAFKEIGDGEDDADYLSVPLSYYTDKLFY